MKKNSYKVPSELSGLERECSLKHAQVICAILSGDFSSKTSAYISVYPDSSRASASVSVHEILRIPKNFEFYKAYRDFNFRLNAMSKDEAISRLTDFARINISDLCEFKKTLIGQNNGEDVYQTTWLIKDSAKLDDRLMSGILELKPTPQGLSIKLQDQRAAIAQLSKMLNWDSSINIALDITPDIPSLPDWIDGG